MLRLINLVMLLCFTLFFSSASVAKVKEYELIISKGPLNIEGKSLGQKLFMNGGIPGPELVFTEGDVAEIRVINETDEKTLIHWHGILLPNNQDGVPYVNSPPIEPHSEKLYKFPIKQTGTYWYHSHVMFQEEDGLYGAIKILPAQAAETVEKTILFADLTSESGKTVHRNLKKDGEYYDVFKGTVQSWYKALKTGTALTKWRNSLQRMEGMDYADIAYDFFTANGLPSIEIFNESDSELRQVKLRLINGSATSIFKLTFAGGPMTVIAADGLPVEPVKVHILPMSVAETYDVLVDLRVGKKLELRATSFDNSGFSSVWIGSGNKISAPPMPWENPIGVTMGEMMGMPNIGFWSEFAMVYRNEFEDIPRDIDYEVKDKYTLPSHDTLMPMMSTKIQHMSMKPEDSFRIMNRSPEARRQNKISELAGGEFRELTYGLLRSKESIDIDSDKKLRIIPFTLTGNMENFVWSINGRPVGADTYIKINKGERVRFVMKNTTMMNHPMHLHGHFFRVMTNQGKWSVLKHTVNVPPLSTTVMEFDATEEKDWFFHCHILYHMMDGMTRIVRYENQPGLAEFEKLREESEEFNMPFDFFLSTKILAQSNYSRLEGKYFNSYYMFEYDFLGNYDEDFEGELHAARTLTRFLNLYVGAKTEAEEGIYDVTPTFGFTWILPLNIEVDLKYQPELKKDFELEFENEIQLTDKLQFNIEYSSVRRFYTELEYRQTKHLSYIGSYNKIYDKWGAGLGYTY